MTAGCVTTKGCCGAATVTTAGWYDTAGGGGGGGGCCWFRAAAPCVRAPTISDVRLFMFFLYDGEVLGVRRIRTKAGRRRDGRDVFLRVRARRAMYPRRPRRVALRGGDHPVWYGTVQPVRCGTAGGTRLSRPRRGAIYCDRRPYFVHGSPADRSRGSATLPVRTHFGRSKLRPSRVRWVRRTQLVDATRRGRRGYFARRAEHAPGQARGVRQPLTTPPRLRQHGSTSQA